MIDAQLVSITKATKAKLAGMRDARPSERMRVVEGFQDAFRAVLKRAADGITVEQKVALFDSLLAGAVERVTTKITGEYLDEDTNRYVIEEVVQGTLGRQIYDATNEIEDILKAAKTVPNDD
jgi:hypothetical protein